MQSLRKCVQGLTSAASVFRQPVNVVLPKTFLPTTSIHTSSKCERFNRSNDKPTKFVGYNKVIYPVQSPDEERRPAFVCHMKNNIKYSPKKMWYIASLVRGMSVDEAIKQLSFLDKKGAVAVKETILEAQKLAVEEHNVEFKSNLWVAESFSGKAHVIKGIRRHAKARMGEVRYTYIHYFVRLEEGKPPENYYHYRVPKSKDEHLEAWVEQMRKRKVINSL